MADTEIPDISIVIPAYNEEAVIAGTVEALAAAFEPSGLSYEIVVADDASRDRTWQVLEELKARFPALRPVRNTGPGGYGMAVRCGLANYRGRGVIVSMADGSDRPQDVLAYARALQEGYDCAFGSRFSSGAEVRDYPPVKRLVNRAGNWLISKLAGRDYDDFTNGFKGYSRATMERMQPLVCCDFNLTVEMSIKAVLTGARFAVVPTAWKERDAGVSKFRLARLAGLYLLTLAYVFLQHYLSRAGARPRG